MTKTLLALLGVLAGGAVIIAIARWVEGKIAPAVVPTGQPTPAENKIVVETKAAVSDLEGKRAKVATEVQGETLEQVVDGLNGGTGHSGDD